MKPEVSLQHRTILTIATFWADHLRLELCPKHTLEKLAQDEERICSLSGDYERLEDKLKGTALREKLLIEEKTQAQANLKELKEGWFEEAMRLDREVTYYKRLLALCLCLSSLVLMLGFYLGKLAGGLM